MKPRKRLPAMSVKRAAQAKVYSKRKKVFLSKNVQCFCCEVVIHPELRELHHLRGRAGKLYLDERFWRMACSGCHTKIHQCPNWAKANGFLGGPGEWGVCPK